MNRKLFLLLYLILFQFSCREDFNPVIDTQIQGISVEALVTNLPESYNIKISNAIPFDSSSVFSGIKGALVSIKDDAGNSYHLHESAKAGNYYSEPYEFVAVIGRSYTLHIELPSGDIYESSPQKLTRAASIDSLYGNVTKKQYLYKDQLGNMVTKMVQGSETFMDLSYNTDSIIRFRFDNTLVKCFTYWNWYTPEMKAAKVAFPPPNPCYDTACPYVVYNWQKFKISTIINLTNTTSSFAIRKMRNNSVCFFPFDNSFFPILQKQDSCAYNWIGQLVCATVKGPSTLEGDLLQTRVYSLNNDAAVFYSQLNDQLSSQGRIFDHIAVQLQGNIKCINNSHKIALGLFEVSSCLDRSFRLSFNYQEGRTDYLSIPDISAISYSGSDKSIPDFWQKIFFN